MMYGEMGRLADESLRLGLRQAETAVLFALAAQHAGLEFWLAGYRAAETAAGSDLDHRERTRRLIRRGIAPAAAAQELHLV